jgi:hypothetical protein
MNALAMMRTGFFMGNSLSGPKNLFIPFIGME